MCVCGYHGVCGRSQCVRMCSECVRMSRVYRDMCVYIDRACVYAGTVENVYVVSVFVCVCSYGVATISRLLKIIGLFCRI